MRFIFILSFATLLLSQCVPQREDSATAEDLPDVVMHATPPAEWVEERVAATQERLNATAAGQHIWQAMEAHGGLARWFNNGPLEFQFNYQPLDGSTPRNTYEVAKYWSAQTRLQLVEDTTVQFGWDGERAWASPTDTLIPYNVRFWSLTPYYFVGIPFVLGDEGIRLESLGESSFEEKRYDLVKVTYDQGIGDAPDDYYVIYVGQEDHRIGALRYIVSYPGYFPDGGHAPEKLMALNGTQTINGIILPKGYRTFWWKEEQAGQHITDIEVSGVSFRPEVRQDYFIAPDNAQTIQNL